jgi:hypothetical protein
LPRITSARSGGDLRTPGDLERFRFENCRNTAVRLDGPYAMNAIYGRAGETWVLLGNAEGESKSVRVAINGAKLRSPLSRFDKAELFSKGSVTALNSQGLFSSGVIITVPANSLAGSRDEFR